MTCQDIVLWYNLSYHLVKVVISIIKRVCYCNIHSKFLKTMAVPFFILFLLLFSNQVYAQESTGEKLYVHFIDVGQADSILIEESSGKNILIDGGNRGDTELLKDYLKDNNIKTIDLLIGTHPHEDHIGGLKGIIEAFNIGTIYMPKVVHTSSTYENLLKAIKKQSCKITTPKAGTSFELGDVTIEILAPNSNTYESLNNYSIIIRLIYGNTSFLFTGDAEGLSEQEILDKGYNISSNVLKVAHHGSRYSTTEEFLKKVSPEYAVISSEIDNSYGHPHREVLEMLNKYHTQIYRTDEMGTIILSSDKNTITLEENKGSSLLSLIIQLFRLILELFE